VKPYLLDTNLLIALAWPSHLHHSIAQRWFAKKGKAGFRTCPITEMGFVRISSNPLFTPDAVSPREALVLLERITSLPEHKFWADDLDLSDAIGKNQSIIGHRQVTDAYLLALARARRGILATLDRGILSLSDSKDGGLELLQGV
jgi:toxin-antitoxin system PIN domain toxin